jgi:hypothetical protein
MWKRFRAIELGAQVAQIQHWHDGNGAGQVGPAAHASVARSGHWRSQDQQTLKQRDMLTNLRPFENPPDFPHADLREMHEPNK